MVRLLITICALVVFFIVGTCHAQKPVPVLLAYEDTALPPFYLGEGTAIPEAPGILVDLLRIVDEQMPQIEISFRRIPWKRCLFEMEEGVVDGTFPGSYKPKRTQYGAYPMLADAPDKDKSMVNLSYYFYKLRKTPVVHNGTRLVGMDEPLVGVPRGYSAADYLRERGYSVDESGDTRQNLTKLVLGRLPVVALQDVTVEPLINGNEIYKDVVRIEPPVKTNPNYLLFSHQFMARHPELARKIWAKVAELKESEMGNIAARYVQ